MQDGAAAELPQALMRTCEAAEHACVILGLIPSSWRNAA